MLVSECDDFHTSASIVVIHVVSHRTNLVGTRLPIAGIVVNITFPLLIPMPKGQCRTADSGFVWRKAANRESTGIRVVGGSWRCPVLAWNHASFQETIRGSLLGQGGSGTAVYRHPTRQYPDRYWFE